MISAEADAAELDLPSGFDWRNGRKQLGCRQRMKNFFTSMLGALVALVIFSAGCLFLFIGLIGALAAMGGGTDEKKAPSLENGAYVVFDLSSNITDAPAPFDLSAFNGGKNETMQLRTITRSLRAAARDDRITGLFLMGNLSPSGYGTGYATLKEVRAAIEDFKEAGKP